MTNQTICHSSQFGYYAIRNASQTSNWVAIGEWLSISVSTDQGWMLPKIINTNFGRVTWLNHHQSYKKTSILLKLSILKIFIYFLVWNSSVFHFPMDWLCFLKSFQAKVQAIHIEGVTRTKNDIIAKHVGEIFKANNFEDVSTS